MSTIKHSPHTHSGFTILELMLTVTIVSILISIAVPAMINTFARSEIKSAKEGISQTLRKAKHIARTANTTITVEISLNPQNNTITSTLPNGSNQLPDGTRLNNIDLPDRIAVSSTNNNTTYSFNSFGMLDIADVGVISLTSTRNTNETGSVRVLNILGQLQVD